MLREPKSDPSNDASFRAENRVRNTLTTQTKSGLPRIYGHHRFFLNIYKHTCLDRVSTRVCKVHCHCVRFREEREKTHIVMVQDPGFTLKSTVTSAVWFSSHITLNKRKLLCHGRSTPREIDASTKHHPLCVHASLSSQLVLQLSHSGKLDSCSTALITVPVSLLSTLVIASVTTIFLLFFF